MRWSLRSQILLPMLCVVCITLVSVSLLNAYLSARKAKSHIHHQLREVAKTLSHANFPLTDSVLEQVRGLSGAEFVVIQNSGEVVASSIFKTIPRDLPKLYQTGENLVLGKIVQIKGDSYFHASVNLAYQSNINGPKILHIFYPEKHYRDVLQNAVVSPLIVGGIALILVIIISIIISSRVTRPLHLLKNQVERIAQGNFQLMPLPHRNDEILDLGQSVNRMTEMLVNYENKVRQQERIRTLGQLSGSMVHQLRNAATGCRMAIELHCRKCPSESNDETMTVALRQLKLMDRYLKQFFSHENNDSIQHISLDLIQIVKDVLSLLRPGADHARVSMEIIAPEHPIIIQGDSNSLRELIINLLQNAIDATATPSKEKKSSQQEDVIIIEFNLNVRGHVLLEVKDSGPGPALEMEKIMFDPLATGKIDGTGLGLSVALKIAKEHQSEIHWERRNGMTHFTVKFPLENKEKECVKITGC